MENLIKLIPEFLKDINLVYIIGIVSAVSSALWAYRKFLYEKQLEKFKDANINLFKTDKQEVLAAIATLGFFNRDRKFKQNTIDILLSRLYTELDYDITNAIASALIQYSNRRELKYIADELVGINRNFFLQTYPVGLMIGDLKKKWSFFKNLENAQLPKAEMLPVTETENVSETQKDILEKTPLPEAGNVSEIERDNIAAMKEKLQMEYQRLYPKSSYELTWHKQVTADTYSRIMRKASRESKFTRQLRRLEMKLYQNDFNFTHMVKINTSKCSIDNSALSLAILSEIVFSNIDCIKDSTFYASSFRNCTFIKGKIIGSDFISCAFDNVVFNDICFEESFFWSASFSNCEFINCRNVTPVLFYKATFENTELPFPQESISALKIDEVYKALDECKVILKTREDDMRATLDSYFIMDSLPPETAK